MKTERSDLTFSSRTLRTTVKTSVGEVSVQVGAGTDGQGRWGPPTVAWMAGPPCTQADMDMLHEAATELFAEYWRTYEPS